MFTLNTPLTSGARREILDAALELHRRLAEGEARREQVDQEYFEKLLYTADLPPLDLLIRTSGELRVSNFMLWQIAYAELYVTPVLWPDFGPSELLDAILDYQNRDRRFGGLSGRPHVQGPESGIPG